MSIFGKSKKVEELERLKAEIETLRDEKQKAKEELAQVKHEKKMEEEDIKHMVRLKEERLEVEKDKAMAKMERERDEAIAKVKDEYRDKMEQRLQEEVKGIKAMYSEVLARLPNVTAKLTGDI